MRIAIISDIHANLEALTSAIREIDRSDVNQVVCLGDVVGYGANPNECLDLVRNRCGNILLGNHDAAAVDLDEAEYFNPNARIAAAWTNKQLSDENRDYLAARPLSARLSDVLFVHASPCNPRNWEYILYVEEAMQAFRCFTEPLCFVGHTHVPAFFSEDSKSGRLKKDARALINVGSVGQPRDGNPELGFGILDTDAWEFKQVRAAYDVDGAAGKIREAGLPKQLAERLYRGI